MNKKLSIVIASSNSNFGGEIYREVEPAVPTPEEKRLELSMFTLHEAFKSVDYEVVFVEWNRLKDRKPYRDYDFMKHPRVRVIEVPKEFSEKVLGTDLPFHEMWAKNVGIRRANGSYILGTNIDVLWLNDMSAIFGENKYPNTPMISWRWSVYHPVLDFGFDLGKIREYCFNDKNRLDYDKNSNGDFTLMTKDEWFNLLGYSITFPGWAGCDMWMVKRAAEKKLSLDLLPFPIYHIRHPGRPLGSGFGITNISTNFGAPEETFPEWVNGVQVK